MTSLRRSTATSLAVLMLGAAFSPLAALAQPANDECAGALDVPCGSSATVDNTTATTAGSDPVFACAGTVGARSTWYKFTATITTATVDTEGSAIGDTVLQVFSGACGALTVIGCDDDSGTGLLSVINLTGLTVGNTYYIEAANYSTGTTPGNMKVNVTCTPPPPPPPNDECAGALDIACDSSATVNNTAATTAASDPNYACRVGGVGQGSRSTWYKFTASTAAVTIDTEGSVVTDTLLHVFSGSCASLTVIGCDDDAGTGFLSLLNLTGLTIGDTYYIEASNWATTTTPGNITVNVRCSLPLGVVCNNTSAGQGTNATVTAVVSPGTNPASTFITCSVNTLALTGGAGAVPMLDDGVPPDAFANDNTYTASVAIDSGQAPGPYTLPVSVSDAQARAANCNITLTVTPPPPANDECAGAVAIACGGSATVDNTNASTAAGDPNYACRVGGATQGARSTWYKFVAADVSARIDTEGSVVTDTLLHVMDGTCASLTVIGCDDDGGTGLLSLVDVYGLTVGNTYYIEASNWSSGTTPGNITVNITCPAPPPPGDPINDDCNSPIVIAALPYNDFRTNDLATADGPPGSCNTGGAVTLQNSIWYQWTSGQCDSGTATLTVEAEYDILANVWTGSCVAGFAQVPDPNCEGDEPQPVAFSWSVSPNTTYTIQIGDWGTGEGGGPTLISLSFAGAPCPGDADGDGDVDQDDLDLVLFNFGTSVPIGLDGDVDCDGDVDQDDLDLTLFYFGVVCP